MAQRLSFLVQMIFVESESANAETITRTLVTELNHCDLSVGKLNGLCTDGASVMTGKTSGVANRLKELNKHLVSVHCICHKLSLACCDTNDDMAYMQEVERWLFQIWKFFENSPKRLAAYLKTQLNVKKLQEPSKEAKDKCVRRLAKATRTRWLSIAKAVESVHKDYVPLMLTLKQLDQKDAQASGLLGKMHKVKFIGVVTVMHLTASDRDKLFLTNFLVKYVNSLKESLSSRFPALPLLSAFSRELKQQRFSRRRRHHRTKKPGARVPLFPPKCLN